MNRFVVLDFETYPVDGKSFIMEIGCVEVLDGVIGRRFQTLVRPVAPVTDFVMELTGIQQSDLDVAPEFFDVIDGFYSFIQNSVVVAHNANLDCLSYESLCRYLGIEPKRFLWLDSQDLIKILDPSVKSLKLHNLLLKYGFHSENSHRAEDDALGLAKLLVYYAKHHTLLLTQREVSFFKKSRLDSIQLLVKFLLINFNVDSYDSHSLINAPSYNELNSDEYVTAQQNMVHYNMSSDDLLAELEKKSDLSLIVTTEKTYLDVPYIASPSMYVFPDKIPRLYPIITDVRVSHVEFVELYGIINWLRQTQTYQLTDMNDQLVQRYHQLVKGVLDTHPLSLVNFIRNFLSIHTQPGRVIECHYEMLVLILTHSPQVLSRFSIVLHNFMRFNFCLSQINEKEFSFSSLKALSKSITNLAFIIDYLTYLGEDNLKFVQDFARLKSFIHLINEEKLQLFQKADHLVENLSMNIYGFEKRQVLINDNVFETMEWQELLGSLNIVIHYLEEMLKLFQKISFYIYSDLNGWFSDLIYEFTFVKTNAQAFLNLPSKGVLFIDSPVKHKPSNCKLVIKNLHEHHFYSSMLQNVDQLFVHQQLYGLSVNSQVASYLGIPALKEETKTNRDFKLSIEFKSHDQLRSIIMKEVKHGPLLIALSSKKRIRYWKQKLRSLILSRQVNPSLKIFFKTYSDLKIMDDQHLHKLIFPEFMVQDILQPIHQIRLLTQGGSENDYIQGMFYEELHMILDDLGAISTSSILLNLDFRLKPIISIAH